MPLIDDHIVFVLKHLNAKVHFQEGEALDQPGPSFAWRRSPDHPSRWCHSRAVLYREIYHLRVGKPVHCRLCPARSHRAISTPHTPPACRECPPNCLIFLNSRSTLQGFSPSSRLFKHQRVLGTGVVTHFTQSVDSLIGINANDRARHGSVLPRRRCASR